MVLPERHEARSRKMSFRRLASVDGRDRTEIASCTGMSIRGLSDRFCVSISWTGKILKKMGKKTSLDRAKTRGMPSEQLDPYNAMRR